MCALDKTWCVSTLLIYEEHKDYKYVSEDPLVSMWYHSL